MRLRRCPVCGRGRGAGEVAGPQNAKTSQSREAGSQEQEANIDETSAKEEVQKQEGKDGMRVLPKVGVPLFYPT